MVICPLVIHLYYRFSLPFTKWHYPICFSKSEWLHDIVIGLFINRYEFGRQFDSVIPMSRTSPTTDIHTLDKS